MRRVLMPVFALALCVLAASPAFANKRVALIIGVNAYQSLSPLTNPVPDAQAIAAALKTYGFAVTEHYDLDRATMLDALEEFSLLSGQAQIALVYYAGHGMEIAGKNILAPKDMEIDCVKKSPRRSVDLNQLFDAVAGAPHQVVLLDSCRNDPFPQCPSRSAGSGAGFRGISRAGGEGASLLIANATLSGQLAADGSPGQHSPFAKALLARFKTDAHMHLRDLLDSASQDVSVASRGGQVPEILTRGGSPRVCLNEAACGQPGQTQASLLPEGQQNPAQNQGQALGLLQQQQQQRDPQPQQQLAAIDPTAMAAQAWEEVKNSSNQTVIAAFIARYNDSFYRTLAEERLNELRRSAKTHGCAGTAFEDVFDAHDPKWGPETDQFKTADGQFKIQLEPHKLNFTVNQASFYDDAEVCVTYKFEQGTKTDQAWGGVVFWYTDAQNLYAFGVSPGGTIAVWRLVNNAWENPVPWAANAAVRAGVGAVNNIRVVTQGPKALLYVNDVHVQTITGQPPAGGQLVGLIGEALEKADYTVHAFDNFSVSPSAAQSPDLLAEQASEHCGGSRVLLADDFAAHDKRWGSETDQLKNLGGKFSIQLEPNHLDFALNQNNTYKNADVCVTYVYAEGSKLDQAWGGIVFWASDNQNLYAFGVSATGTIAVWRLVKNKWQPTVEWIANGAVRTGPGAVNHIRVVTKGKEAVFYVNGVQVEKITGSPPKRGGRVGVIGESLEKGDRAVHTFDDFRVAMP